MSFQEYCQEEARKKFISCGSVPKEIIEQYQKDLQEDYKKWISFDRIRRAETVRLSNQITICWSNR